MPEALVVARVMNRIEDETLDADEGILKFLFATDIVRAIHETLQLLEADDFNVAWGFVKDEVTNLSETRLRFVTTVGDYLVKFATETINVAETKVRKLTFVLEEAIIKIVAEVLHIQREFFSFDPPYYREGPVVRVLNRIRTEREQISETRIKSLEEIVVKVISDALNISETSLDILTVVSLELVKVVNESIQFVDSAVYSVLFLLGIVRVRNEALWIYEPGILEEFISPVIYIIGQLTGIFGFVPRLRGIFRVNQDVEQ